jgi:hypothetical protein
VQILAQKNAILTKDFVGFPLYHQLGGVGIATGYRLSGPGSIRGKVRFSSHQRPDRPTQLSIQWVPGRISPGLETDYSASTSSEVKNGGAIPPLPNMSS